MLTNLQKNSHLLWRAGFGPAAAQLPLLNNLTPAQLFKNLQQSAAKTPGYLDATNDHLKGLFKSIQEGGQTMEREERRAIVRQALQAVKDLNLLWLDEMVQSPAQLREKIAFFWHGHFTARGQHIFFQQQMLHLIRENALGSFRTLLHSVSKSAAMLNFLNAQQNRKDHPNENFAREVMELFTLGRGHYTETDVKEAARAFTGWSATIGGDFYFRRAQHDGGTKTVLGKTGNFGGEEVLDILLEKKETARYITQKIYRFFVNETADKEKVDWLANRFYQSDYNIGAMMQDIFTADWFYDPKNGGAKIKSPVELLVGLQRILPMQIENKDSLQLLQRLLGQVLFYPPNVAGWPGGTAWIDSSTLLTRMRLPQLLSNRDDLNLKPKTDDDQMMGRGEMANSKMGGFNKGQLLQASINWNAYIKGFENVSRQQLLQAISSTLLQKNTEVNEQALHAYIDSSSRESYIRSATLQIMSLPEYQVC